MCWKENCTLEQFEHEEQFNEHKLHRHVRPFRIKIPLLDMDKFVAVPNETNKFYLSRDRAECVRLGAKDFQIKLPNLVSLQEDCVYRVIGNEKTKTESAPCEPIIKQAKINGAVCDRNNDKAKTGGALCDQNMTKAKIDHVPRDENVTVANCDVFEPAIKLRTSSAPLHRLHTVCDYRENKLATVNCRRENASENDDILSGFLETQHFLCGSTSLPVAKDPKPSITFPRPRDSMKPPPVSCLKPPPLSIRTDCLKPPPLSVRSDRPKPPPLSVRSDCLKPPPLSARFDRPKPPTVSSFCRMVTGNQPQKFVRLSWPNSVTPPRTALSSQRQKFINRLLPVSSSSAATSATTGSNANRVNPVTITMKSVNAESTVKPVTLVLSSATVGAHKPIASCTVPSNDTTPSAVIDLRSDDDAESSSSGSGASSSSGESIDDIQVIEDIGDPLKTASDAPESNEIEIIEERDPLAIDDGDDLSKEMGFKDQESFENVGVNSNPFDILEVIELVDDVE